MNDYEKISQIIKTLSQQTIGNEVDNILNDLKELYQDNYRHQYSTITGVLLDIFNASKDEKDSSTSLMIISENLYGIYTIARTNENIERDICEKIAKLYDHVNLECIRLGNQNDSLRIINEKLQYSIQKEQEIVEKLEKQQTQYITILGIFASIVLAFVGGLTFSTSVFANIDKASIYRLIFVMSFVALFIGNILFALFNFLSRIALSIQEYKVNKIYLCFNILLFIIMLAISIAYFINSSHMPTFKQHQSNNELEYDSNMSAECL